MTSFSPFRKHGLSHFIHESPWRQGNDLIWGEDSSIWGLCRRIALIFFSPMNNSYIISNPPKQESHSQGLIFSLMLPSRDLLCSSVLAHRQSILSYRPCLLTLIVHQRSNASEVSGRKNELHHARIWLEKDLGSGIRDGEAAINLSSCGNCLGTDWVWRRQRSYSWALHRHPNREWNRIERI